MRLERSSWTEQLFSPKALRPIPISSQLTRDAVIQALLDPRVRTLSFVRTLRFHGALIRADLLLLQGDERVAVEVLDPSCTRTLDEIGLLLLALERSGARLRQLASPDIEREPLLSNSRLIWNARDLVVRSADRDAIFSALKQGVNRFGELRRSCGVSCETVHA